jgi:hypothetical protein
MQRTIFAIAALVAFGGLVSSAQAVWIDEGAHYIKRGYRQNKVWPWPYVCADRIAVREPFCLMINNGWRRQNLLGPHHFSFDSSKLTSAGELRVRWIMTQAPAERRTIFIERDVDPTVTAERMATARAYISQVGATDGQLAQVVETHLISEGRPASVVDETNVRFYESLPPPTLPAMSASAGGTDSP